MGHHGEAHHSAMWHYSASTHITVAIKHANKLRWAFDGKNWLMLRMNEFPGGAPMLYGEPPPWAAEAIAMLRMVEENKEVKNLGFRYSDSIFYIEGALEKNDQAK